MRCSHSRPKTELIIITDLIRTWCEHQNYTLTVIIRRSEGVIRDAPARREDDEISNGDPRPSGFGRQDSEDGRILKERVSEQLL